MAGKSARKSTAQQAGKPTTAKKAAKPKPGAKSKSAAVRRQRAAERKEQKRLEEELGAARDGLTTGAAKTIEHADLYRAIYVDWAEGYDYGALAEKHGLGIRRCQQIVSELRRSRLSVLRIDDPLFGLETAQDLILRWSHAISGYAKLARDTTNDNVKLGAMRDRDRAMQQFAELLQELGLLPKQLGTLRVVEDWMGLIDTLLEKMDELGIPVDVQRELVAAVEVRVEEREKGGRLQLAQGVWEGSAREVESAAA
jgi:hypothetical protein